MTEIAAQANYGDPLSAPFWAAAMRHELLYQRCAICEYTQLPPRPFCLRCRSDEVAWQVSAGGGTVISRTVVRVAVRPELEPPYVVLLVELDEGFRMVGRCLGDAAIGARVAVSWESRADLPPFPCFEAETP